VIIVCINNIIPMASGCFICINIILDIILNINNFLISGSILIKIPALEVGDEYILFSEVLKVVMLCMCYVCMSADTNLQMVPKFHRQNYYLSLTSSSQ
jgi:hypothetical protein